jgi:molybdopterin-guanine dinucleotide biosynthesis protein A
MQVDFIASMTMAMSPYPVTIVILAGGLGQRIGGNKGMQMLHGKPLVSWVLDGIGSAGGEVLLNVHIEQESYKNLGYRLIADKISGWQGPLAGIHAALCAAETEYVMSVPCDTPFLPKELRALLLNAIVNEGTEAAVAVAGGRRQPAIALFRRQVLPGLEVFLGAGHRKVGDWLNTLRLSEVIFDRAEDFDNINSPEDLLRAEQRVTMQS